MSKINFKSKWLVIIIALLVIIIALGFTLPRLLNNNSSNNPDSSQSAENNDNSDVSKVEEPDDTDYDAVKPPLTDLPATVVIPSQKDPETGEDKGISFPHTVEGYNMVIEKIAPYDGIYVEDGSNSKIKNVAMLLIKNNGDYPIEYSKICVEYQNESLIFEISALPAGESVVAQEKSGKAIPNGIALSGTALVVQRADMEMSSKLISVKDNGDNTLTVTNLTNKTIPTVRVFYKYYMKDENVYVGGIAFTSRITRLAPKQSITLHPSHYTSESSKIVMALTYDN